jgi:molybdopterin-guanine dinucleotide biosynthesis protein B
MSDSTPPVLGFAASSGTGKTTLLKRLIPLLRGRGLRIGLVKHAHHDVQPDTPGKDSYELRKAGASQVLLASNRRWALFTEREQARDPVLADMLPHMGLDALDLVLVEGFKHEPIPKIELFRAELGRAPLYPQDCHVIAVAARGGLPVATTLPVLALDDPAAIAAWITAWADAGHTA